MPIDLLCALEPKGLGGQLKRRLEHANVLLAVPRLMELRAALRAGTPDMVVASTGFLCDNIEGWIAETRALPDSPDVVLLHDREDPVFRAAMIRAGCLGVLDASARSPFDEVLRLMRVLGRLAAEAAQLAFDRLGRLLGPQLTA